MEQNKIQKLFLIIFSLWFGMTIMVDFVAIPQAFRTLPNKEMAGQLGVKVFSIFNWFEVVFALPIFTSAFFLKFASCMKKRAYAAIAVTLMALSISYFYHITPAIVDLSTQMHSLTDSNAIAAVQTQHDFYHKLYVKLDGLKLILLILGSILLFSKSEEA